jgi:hypothetical protein
MKDLALATIAALDAADLDDEIEALQSRVFSRSIDDLFDTHQLAEDAWQCSFKPMVELALLEIESVARATAMSLEERRRQIRWVLDAVGF